MSRVLITGGTGVLGRKLAPRLLEQGHTVRIGSRGERRDGFADVEWARMKLATGEGTDEVLAGVDTIVHAASTPVFSQRVDVAGTDRLLRVALEHGVRHLVYISIVGIDGFPFSYYRAKKAAEELIESSSVPDTILRATQFHELVDHQFLPALFKLPFIALVPTDFRFQLIDSGEVADRLVELVAAGPSGRVTDVGGPHVLTLGKVVSAWQRARKTSKRVVHLHVPGAAAAAFRRGQNTCPDEAHGTIQWEDYLAAHYRTASA